MCMINRKKMKELREEMGLSQAEFAKKLGVSTSTVNNWENGNSNPKDEAVEKMCLLLKINKDEIEVQDVGYDFLNSCGKVAKSLKKYSEYRLRSPEETEAWIKERNKASEEEELREIKTVMKFPMKFANKTYVLIDPKYIHFPAWQRDTDFAKAGDIAQNFKEEKFDPVKVFLINGKFYVADGGHRTIACIMAGFEKILVEIIFCTEQEAKIVFLGQQGGRRTMTKADMYRAGVSAGIPEYLVFKEIFESYNIQITSEPVRLENPVGKVVPSDTALRLANRKQEILGRVLRLICDLKWCGSTTKNAFSMRNINVLIRMFAVYGDDVEWQLMEKCKGVTYFEGKVAPVKSDAELFDILSDDILK